jgi:hypothetical protein
MWTLNGAPQAFNVELQNKSNTGIIVIAFCNATRDAADLDGYIGEKSASKLLASQSGTGRKTITILVPAHWFYKIRVDPILGGGSCEVTSWPLN